MINNDGRHRNDSDAFRSGGRSRHLENLTEDFRRLDAAQRDAASTASPLGRALIESSRAATYQRLAPLVADLDRTWTPASAPAPDRRGGSTSSTEGSTRPLIPATAFEAITTIDTDAAVSVSVAKRPESRTWVVEILTRAVQVARHPRRRSQG
ncbi:hypothetical protein CYJ73_25000 [Gordonia terrae]|uniref:Uncharacterized protein n=1 Tax=Gordonia terrae TaxID=2055 RepID=A0A2I1R114_9ACTN|nr:hypothetical protein CYJ73_25000 [Gordonia terrae]